MTHSAARPGDRPSGHVFATRSPAVGRHGMIATSQSLASAAGLKVLQDGGNAIDAAVTAAGVLAVVPYLPLDGFLLGLPIPGRLMLMGNLTRAPQVRQTAMPIPALRFFTNALAQTPSYDNDGGG
jgi:hypothetical protein